MPEKYITLAEAAKLAPTRPSANAVWRWCRRGIKARNGSRVRLAHVRVGGRVFTTHDNVEAFFAELADADAEYFGQADAAPTPHVPSKSGEPRQRPESQRDAAIAQATAELEDAGI